MPESWSGQLSFLARRCSVGVSLPWSDLSVEFGGGCEVLQVVLCGLGYAGCHLWSGGRVGIEPAIACG